MAEILLNKIINKQIKVDLLIKWLLEANAQESNFSGFNDFKCSQADFLTYFLNFVHEEVPCLSRYGESPQKPNNKHIERLENNETTSNKVLSLSQNEDKSNINKSPSHPYVWHRNGGKNDESFENGPTSSPHVWHKTSTPKLIKIHPENTLNNVEVSPVSPLYRSQNNFSTPKNGRQMFTNKSSEKGSSLCLGDFIVNRKSSSKKKTNRNILSKEPHDESSKRIKPTCLSQVRSNSSFRKSENSFNNFQNTKEVSVECVNDSRNFLAEERLKILSRKDSGSNLTVASSKTLASLFNFKTEVEPAVDSVTNREQLDFFVEIYATILKFYLVLNITSEIYFLISLLLTKHFNGNRESPSTSFSDEMPVGVDFLNDEGKNELQGVLKCSKKELCCSELFESVHNVVYFSVRCLETQVEVVKCYDKSTLHLLSQNKRLRLFSGTFADKLGKISEKKSERVLELPESTLQTTVCFNLDTDNRENFPSDSTFHTFRKQRDLFYEILRIWEKQHLVTGWSFAVSLGAKIKSLFGLQCEPVTYVHFSRLFKAQLLSNCGKLQKEEGVSDIPFLSSIPNVDADKLNRLNCRLTTKQSSNGINSVPVFTGHQEFYKDFIVIAANYSFNQHFCDTLISEIVELNDAKFSCSNLEEIDIRVDPSTRKAYTACLKSLRVLAKFLGFVESLPYKTDSNSLSEKVLNFQISLRKEVAPSFDVLKLLENSVKLNSIVVVVPWLSKYLSMLDYVTLRLPYYLSVYEILFNLYKNCEKILVHDKNRSHYNASLVKFCLGWLFELSHFPDSEYFNFCTRPTKSLVSRARTPTKKCKGVTEQKLDKVDIVDQNILYVCCPYLEEIKKLLASNAQYRSVTVKHITPVTAAQSSNEIAKKKLELHLEEAFFNGQPLSLKKTVEFVSERVASACVKHICTVIVPAYKKSALANLKDFLGTWVKDHNVNSPTKEKSLKSALRSTVNQMAQSNLKTLKESCDKEVSVLTKERVPSGVTSLLSVDVLTQTKDVCVAITGRMCVERVQQWINSHITLSVFTKDFNGETQKILCPESKKSVKDKEKPLFVLPPGGAVESHNESATSAFHMLDTLKGLSMTILENSDQLSERRVGDILDDAYVTVTERSDVNECITASTCALLVDIALLLITHKPRLITNVGLLIKCARLWKRYPAKVEDLFKNLFCPRNVMLLAQSCNHVEVWETFSVFIAFLLQENLLTCEEFESQCTGFYKRDWDQGTLNNYVTFLRKFLHCYRDSGGDTDKFTLLLEFLSDFSADL